MTILTKKSAKSAQKESLKTEWITLAVLLLISAAVLGWAVNHFHKIAPAVETQKTKDDTDDPAIWIHPTDPAKSLILGTDKGTNDGKPSGRLYVFDLSGNKLKNKTVKHLKRPNNVDVEYGFALGDTLIDIAVVTERYANSLRIFRLPDMTPVDNGGIEIFAGLPDSLRQPMGIGLYKRPADGAIFAIVSRKSGPSGSYLWQYLLKEGGNGQITAEKVREFGEFGNRGSEIEAIAVDDELGYVYYSDEYFGVRKYYADPGQPNSQQQLAILATEYFQQDREGIAIYKTGEKTGYILVSDQAANLFHIYKREGEPENPNQHPLIKTVRLSAKETDGCDAVSLALNPQFPHGIFVAMSNYRKFQYYRWEDIAGKDLEIAGKNVQ